ncbi:hypothetical protein BKA64DRAFT_643279 [Cadophora sp. MPI-SDFR-AT-0126]|nr:hypothetical protein BKA64DRAFT_643279 [Leotiomycetes sp. MPI-SDFR-AT-0126]
MVHSTSSTTAVNGSAEEFSPSTTGPPPRTPAQVAADDVLAHQRAAIFIADTSLPVVAPQPHHPNAIATRAQVAGTSIAKFDVSFNNANNYNDGGSGNGGAN